MPTLYFEVGQTVPLKNRLCLKTLSTKICIVKAMIFPVVR